MATTRAHTCRRPACTAAVQKQLCVVARWAAFRCEGGDSPSTVSCPSRKPQPHLPGTSPSNHNSWRNSPEHCSSHTVLSQESEFSADAMNDKQTQHVPLHFAFIYSFFVVVRECFCTLKYCFPRYVAPSFRQMCVCGM